MRGDQPFFAVSPVAIYGVVSSGIVRQQFVNFATQILLERTDQVGANSHQPKNSLTPSSQCGQVVGRKSVLLSAQEVNHFCKSTTR